MEWESTASPTTPAAESCAHLQRHLTVLLLEAVDQSHRAANVTVLRHAERADILLGLEREQIEELAIASAHKEL